MFKTGDNVNLNKGTDPTNFNVLEDGSLWCTHGDWSAKPTIHEDGSVSLHIGTELIATYASFVINEVTDV